MCGEGVLRVEVRGKGRGNLQKYSTNTVRDLIRASLNNRCDSSRCKKLGIKSTRRRKIVFPSVAASTRNRMIQF